MERLPNLGDERQTAFCVHCGGVAETRDHAPSKVFMDVPYPVHMPSLPCCKLCNQNFSKDEEYLAALLDCVISGTTDPSGLRRIKVQKMLARNHKLRQRIEMQKKEANTPGGSKLMIWQPEEKSVANVILKLARCHAAYELNEPRLDDPEHLLAMPLVSMTHGQRCQFESPQAEEMSICVSWPEVGSRAMQRLVIAKDAPYAQSWITVQHGRYRFIAIADGNVTIRGVLSEYLAYEVIWN